MQTTHYLFILLFSCITGWLTVWLVSRILFWPEKPLAELGFRFQGILPAYQPVIAKEIAGVLNREFLSFESLKEKAADPAAFRKLRPEIEHHVDHFLREKLKESFPMLSMLIGDKTINQLKTAFMVELENLFPSVMRSYLANLEKEINPQELIAEKLGSISLKRSSLLANNSAKRLFILLQLAGAFTGLVAGMLQVLFFMLLR